MAAKPKNQNFDFFGDNPAMVFVTKKDGGNATKPESDRPTPDLEPELSSAPTHTKGGSPVVRTQEEINRSKGINNIIDPNGEKRTRRVQLLVRPSLYAKVSRELSRTGESFASLVDNLLSQYVGEDH